MIKTPLAVLLLTCLSSAAFAAGGGTRPPPPIPKPVITINDGEPVVAVFASGNEATLKVNRNPTIAIRADFQVSEISCSADAGQTFQMTLGLGVEQLGFVWTKQKDPAKLGKPVIIGGTFPASAEFILTNTLRTSFPDATKNLPPDSFTFPEVKWIPGLEDGVKRPFTLGSWFVEQMVTNPQTGVDENRIVTSVLGVHVALGRAGALYIDGFDSLQRAGFGGGIFSLIGDVVTWVVNSGGQSCQITSKPDVGAVDSQIRAYANSLKTVFTDYKWNEDYLSKMLGGEKNFLFQDLDLADD